MTDLSQLSAGIPEKHAKLKQAEAAGLLTPKGVLLSFEGSTLVHQDVIDNFVNIYSNNRFIVRSAHLEEDAGDLSLAGHFWSSGPVMMSQLDETIRLAQQENSLALNSLVSSKKSAHPSPLNLILQVYIEHDIGGVVFSPWSFFPDYAYIEYSESGVNKVVEGRDSVNAVLCIEDQYSDPLPVPSEQSPLRQPLISLCRQLKQVYDFPVDCEWAYDLKNQQVTVLQVRPQTHAIGPILPYSMLSEALFHENLYRPHVESLSIDQSTPDSKSQLNKHGTSPKHWQFTALSESLGRLSPLSFSLLKQLYTDTAPAFRALGCQAENVDFMALAPDGTVLIAPDFEARFYSMTLFGGFKRGIKRSTVASEAELFMRQYDVSARFDYEVLQQLFEYWMAANVLSAGAGRNVESALTLSPPHAYELSWPASLKLPLAPTQGASIISFDVLNVWGRALFLFELNKLKQQLRQSYLDETIEKPRPQGERKAQRSPDYRFFGDWQALMINDVSQRNTERFKAYQHELAPLALYDFARSADVDSPEIQTLSSSKLVEGPLCIINNPAGMKQSIPADCILVAPYFDNHWVSQIKSLKGIVVNKGSRLAHSAIVAREYDVPYYVVPTLDLEALNRQWPERSGKHSACPLSISSLIEMPTLDNK